jgi:hypothetical protein
MQLEREIVLYTPLSDEQNAFRRLMLSNGLMRASYLSEKSSFEEEAIVPGEQWEPISPELYHKYFTSESPPEPGSWISIVQIPEEIMDCFRPLQRASAAHWKVEKINELFIDEYFQFQRGIKAVQHYCAHFNEQGICHPDNIGILANPANLLTVTQNLERTRLIGLHLDSYDHNSLEKRHLSSNRICINLGSQDRYFLFM